MESNHLKTLLYSTMKSKIYRVLGIAAALALTCFQLLAGKRLKVLFLGNSYVTTNNLPGIIGQIASSQGDTLVQLTNAPGGFTLANHFANPTTKSLIAQGGWDRVVIQAQSQEPSFPDDQVETQTLPFARKLDSLVHAIDSCTETQFYMTWGRKNGDSQNCAFYPPLCSYEGMQAKLTERYLRMAEEAQGSVAPVGEVWKKFRDMHPSVDLYVSDGSHPSLYGTYLAGLVFYQSLFQTGFSLPVFKPSNIPDSTANAMQALVSQMIQDSAFKWFGKGRLVHSRFSHQNLGLSVQFENESYAARNSLWDFGDGQTSFEENPMHSYAQPGTYLVKLKSSNPCQTHEISKSVLVLATRLAGLLQADFHPTNPIPEFLELPQETIRCWISDLLGRKLAEGKSNLNTHTLAEGVYYLNWSSQNGEIYQAKILKIRQ